jgi:hypothetical protein
VPELVLYDDAQRVICRGRVSEENVAWLARLLRRHTGAVKAAAAVLRALETAKSAAEQIGAPAARGRRR